MEFSISIARPDSFKCFTRETKLQAPHCKLSCIVRVTALRTSRTRQSRGTPRSIIVTTVVNFEPVEARAQHLCARRLPMSNAVLACAQQHRMAVARHSQRITHAAHSFSAQRTRSVHFGASDSVSAHGRCLDDIAQVALFGPYSIGAQGVRVHADAVDLVPS